MLALQLFVCVSLLALQSDAFRLSNYNHQHQHKPVQARRDLSQLHMYSHRYSHTHSPAAIATSCRSCRISSTQRSPLRATGHRLSLRLQSTPTDEQYEEWLDDMIYSGDIAGFIRRRSTDLLSEDFKDFLEEKLLECEEEDEKDVLSEIIGIIDEKLRQTDGMSDSGVAYESRLDKILFTPPNARRDYITEKIEEMTAGFVGYVQKEMKSTTDTDSKVVLASILQLIGQVKNTDLLGNNAALLKNADASLGDQFAKNSTLLEGGSIADSKNLMGGVNLGDRNEQVKSSAR